MVNKKVLIVGTYPIKEPQHGGQKRGEAIYRAYKANFKDVRYVGVYYRNFYKHHSGDDIPLSVHSERLVDQSPLTGDIVCGRAIYEDKQVKRKFRHLLTTFQPHVVHIEQPYPYLGLKPLLRELGMNVKVVFGSQNIEAPMKREILESAGTDERLIKQAVKEIDDVEKELSKEADLLVACTEQDLKIHRKMGAKNVVLAENGIAVSKASQGEVDRWRSKLSKRGVSKSVLFVGSAHPPNWVGFLDMVGKGLGFLDYDARIVMAGSICDYFDREITPKKLDIQDATFWLRAYSAGRLSEQALRALIELADVIILPITEGGGSNVKTAEAILADKKVVATSHALRSYEWFKDFPNLWVADKQTEFQRAIVDALGAAFKPRTEEQRRQAEQVLWENRLDAFVKKARQL